MLKNYKTKYLILFGVLMITFADLSAQLRTLTGKISSSDGDALIGASIKVEGTDRGTITDVDGNYSIEVSNGETLIYEFIGYLSQRVEVLNQTLVNVQLQSEDTFLDDVVVIGYGNTKKSDLTGSVSSVSGEQLKSTLTTNVDQALQGRVAGLQITQNSGQPGGAASLRIRGANSINLSNEPLYVIDGLPFNGDGASTPGFDWAGGANGQNRVNPLSTINPNDIVSIDVLKDASATAIYGSRGANGVIIITTKRGKKGESKISYNTYYGLQTLQKRMEMMTLPQFAEYQNQIADDLFIQKNERFADPSLLGSGTDWQKEIFRDAGSYNHQLSVVGGTDKTTYAISGGFMKQDGIIIGSNFNRFTSRINLENKVKDWFKIGGSLAFARTNEKITLNDGGDGVIAQSLIMMPSVGVRDIDGLYDGPNTPWGANYNPVAAALQRNNTLGRDRLMSTLYGDVSLLKDFTWRSEVNFDNNSAQGRAFQPTFKWGALVNNENKLRQREENGFFWVVKNYLTYNKKIGVHGLTAMLGHEAQRSTWNGSDVTVANLPSNDIQELNQGKFIGNPNSWRGAGGLLSYFGRANYNYRERYLATFTYRADASSNFGPGNKWGYFPSGAIAWRVSEEPFLKESGVIDNLKLRAGYGISGNQAIQAGLFGAQMRVVATPFGNAYRPNNIANPNLGWESTAQQNYGIDLTFLKNRVDLTFDYYHKNTFDMLLLPQPPNFIAGTSWWDILPPMVNIGELENKGFDITLNTRNFSKSKFKWSTDLTYSRNRNKVLELSNKDQTFFNGLYWYSEFQTATVTRVGQPIGMFYGYQADGLFTDKNDILNHAVQVSDKVVTSEKPNGTNLVDKSAGVWIGDMKFKDLNNDGVINTDDQTVIGNPNPDFTFGINNTFSFGPVDFTVYLNGSYGGDILNYARVITEGQTGIYSNQAASVFDRAQFSYKNPNGSIFDPENVTLKNPDTNIPRPATTDNNRNNRMSDRFIEDGSYLRVQNLVLGYTLPSSLTKQVKIQRLKFYANVQNLHVFTNYKGYDPEIGAFNQRAMVQNVDMGRYPTPRMFTFGLDLDF